MKYQNISSIIKIEKYLPLFTILFVAVHFNVGKQDLRAGHTKIETCDSNYNDIDGSLQAHSRPEHAPRNQLLVESLFNIISF